MGGHKSSEGHFGNGRRTGSWTFWYGSGGKSLEGQFENGEKVGDWTHWREDGVKD